MIQRLYNKDLLMFLHLRINSRTTLRKYTVHQFPVSRLVGILRCYKGQKTIYMDRRNIIKNMLWITALNLTLAYFGNLELSEKESWIEIRCTLQRKKTHNNKWLKLTFSGQLVPWSVCCFPCLFVQHFISIFLLFLLR